MDEMLPLPQLIDQLTEAMRTYHRLAFDEESEHEVGKPTSLQQLAKLEKKLGKPLPPSYKAFLELHNGWDGFAAGAKLLAADDHPSELVEERLADMRELFPEVGLENPFEKGALPVMLGEDSDLVLYIDPRTTRPDGEMDFVLLDNTAEDRRFPDFTSFLRYRLDLLRRMIDDQTKGVADDDEG